MSKTRRTKTTPSHLQTYDVAWYIELDAANPVAAAQQALTIQRDPTSYATVCHITNPSDETDVTIDLIPHLDTRRRNSCVPEQITSPGFVGRKTRRRVS